MKLVNCVSLIDAVRTITCDGTRVWLFDVPPYEMEEVEYERALEVNDMGNPISKRTIRGTFNTGKVPTIVEKDKGFGTYKKWDANHEQYDIKAITKEQNALKQLTMAAITTKNFYRFGRKAKHLLNPLTGYKFNGQFLSQVMDEDAKTAWEDILDEIRHQCHMVLMSAILQPELKDKAKLYWDMLKQSDQEAFNRDIRVSTQQNIKVEQKEPLDLPKIVPPDGWEL